VLPCGVGERLVFSWARDEAAAIARADLRNLYMGRQEKLILRAEAAELAAFGGGASGQARRFLYGAFLDPLKDLKRALAHEYFLPEWLEYGVHAFTLLLGLFCSYYTFLFSVMLNKCARCGPAGSLDDDDAENCNACPAPMRDNASPGQDLAVDWLLTLIYTIGFNVVVMEPAKMGAKATFGPIIANVLVPVKWDRFLLAGGEDDDDNNSDDDSDTEELWGPDSTSTPFGLSPPPPAVPGKGRSPVGSGMPTSPAKAASPFAVAQTPVTALASPGGLAAMVSPSRSISGGSLASMASDGAVSAGGGSTKKKKKKKKHHKHKQHGSTSGSVSGDDRSSRSRSRSRSRGFERSQERHGDSSGDLKVDDLDDDSAAPFADPDPLWACACGVSCRESARRAHLGECRLFLRSWKAAFHALTRSLCELRAPGLASVVERPHPLKRVGIPKFAPSRSWGS
jgi:hypothetical protein